MEELDNNWETIAPVLLNYEFTLPKEQHATVARKIRKYYMGDKPISFENCQPLIKMFGDREFGADSEVAALIQAKANQSPVYYYYYNYRANVSTSVEMTFGSYINFGEFD